MRFPFMKYLFATAIEINEQINSDTSALARYLSIPIKLCLIPGFVLGGMITLVADIFVNIVDAVMTTTKRTSITHSDSEEHNSNVDLNHKPAVTTVSKPACVWNIVPSNPLTSVYNRFIKRSEPLAGKSEDGEEVSVHTVRSKSSSSLS